MLTDAWRVTVRDTLIDEVADIEADRFAWPETVAVALRFDVAASTAERWRVTFAVTLRPDVAAGAVER